MQFGEHDDGVEVTIRQAHEITIVLPENPVTGYGWAFEIDGLSIALASDDYKPLRKLVDGGNRTARFTAQRFGVSTICGYLRRPWETHEHAIRTWKITVMVSS